MHRTDLLVITMPRMTHDADPAPGGAVIHGAAKEAGFTSRCVDFNHIFFQMYFHKKNIFHEIDAWMVQDPITLLRMQTLKLSNEATHAISLIYKVWADIIEEADAEYIGFSLFSQNSRRITRDFITFLKLRRPQQKIVVGGSGTSPLDSALRKLVDYYVEGEGERAIVQILQGHGDACSGVNEVSKVQAKNLDELPWADYSDYPLHEYGAKGKKVRITGSRGCVRRCNFCDVYKIWPEYRHRSGKNIAEEIVHHHLTLPTHPQKFIFSDSLINGKPAILREMCEALTSLREKQRLDITFEGQFVAHSRKVFSEIDYKLLKRAGCERVYIGIESGSERIRRAMNKRFTNDSLYFTVEQVALNHIGQIWFIIVGHPDETEEDFQDTLNFFEYFSKYNKGAYRIAVTLHEFTIVRNTDWYEEYQNYISYDQNGEWTYTLNPDLDYHKRYERILRLDQKMEGWGYVNWQPSVLKNPHGPISEIVVPLK